MGKGANHMRLDGQTVLADEKFDLKDGHTAPAPGMSGVAGHDINCRCIVVREVMDDAEFFAKTGRHLPGCDLTHEETKSDAINKIALTKDAPVMVGGVDVTISNGKYGFSNGTGNGIKKTVDAVTYTTPDGVKLVFPKQYNKAQQQMTPEQAIRCWQKVPQKIRQQAQKTIEFVDYYNPQDTYWKKVYKNFTHSYAAGGKKITFYRYDRPHNESYVIRTYCHEAGHYIDMNLSSQSGRFSAGKIWTDAMNSDTMVAGKKSPTFYGENSPAEDFAESIAEYVADTAQFTKLFPGRAAILQNII